jgi:hypothetical protein
MRVANSLRRTQRQKDRRAKPARRDFALYSPRPPLLRDFTKESMGDSKSKTLCWAASPRSRGLQADAFFGASPVVASALGIRLGATPRGRHQATTAPLGPPSKQDISTLLGIGHFYFALTTFAACLSPPPNRTNGTSCRT